MTARPAAGGGRWVSVGPERVGRWIRGFADRHGEPSVEASPGLVTLSAPDGSVAECHVPFPPLAHDGDAIAGLIAHANSSKRVGVLLVRLGGYAAGVFDGDRLVTSKVGARLVHGRSAAGGWSQHRFARRREKQSTEALQAAADVAARVLLPHIDSLDALIVGGDKRAIDELREDRRLTALFALEREPFLTVPDPKLAVLTETPSLFRAVRIRITDAPPA
ncbi:acVLRF1 family peptidyl-tRNA hydrolase [Acrocarpospora macrocephala]|uniref:acVLRF1 family peptidyl-tRNA hydrolase n=1 Tax=Acrocarpospora macrocephala TaxID=150177 RepID=UPI0012D316EF|nr:acVLRF1 family peptidyl-tRNA hydrolase [Acrocarpospora macrocephala]